MAAGAAVGAALTSDHRHHQHYGGRRQQTTTYTTVIQPQPQMVYQAPPVQVVQVSSLNDPVGFEPIARD